MAASLSSRPKREIKKRVVIDFNDFMKSGNEDRELARAIRESLKSASTAPAITSPATTSHSGQTSNQKEKTTAPEAGSSRPKRSMQTGKKSMFDYSDLQSTEREERDVARAIQQSLRLAKDPNDNDSGSEYPILKVNRMNSSKPQRKFAQNSSQGNGSAASSAQSQPSRPAVHRASVQMVRVFPEIIPSTQNFISFLCLRKAPVIAHEIDIPALNRKAAMEKRANRVAKISSSSRADPVRDRMKGFAAAAVVSNPASLDQSAPLPHDHPEQNPNQENEANSVPVIISDGKVILSSSSHATKKDQDGGVSKTNTALVGKDSSKILKRKSGQQKDPAGKVESVKSKSTTAAKSDLAAGLKSEKSITRHQQQQQASPSANDKKRKSHKTITPAEVSSSGSSRIKLLVAKKVKGSSRTAAGSKTPLIQSASHKVTAKRLSSCINRNGKRGSEAKPVGDGQVLEEERVKRQRKMIEKRKEIIKSFRSSFKPDPTDTSSSSDSDDSINHSSPAAVSVFKSSSPAASKAKSGGKKVEARVTRSMQMPSPSLIVSSSKLPSASLSSVIKSPAKISAKRPSTDSNLVAASSAGNDRVLRRGGGQKNSHDPITGTKNAVKRNAVIASKDCEKDFRRVTRTKQFKS